ncbi:TonB-dependent receptor plug domain-containing protein [Hymenobacter yonginensis]|uniref:TonB-dependent receptor plug domain-containing protein n=1 Tax=Hymenobacter yonginensis TaxID=748197 RepID=A0ABY7PMI8_9BACT|nr:TonB-dependent receptor plug domain-containing protein [Hymenobacter yonginensis]WBO83981.1 TonB-dependent receptor plug domain-containing protein [Hymenobacter yonginensis]
MKLLSVSLRLALRTALLVLPAGVFAQAAPAPAPVQASAPSLYFLDGQPSTQQAINELNRRTIASVNVVKGPEATRIFGDGATGGVMVVVTKRNVSSEAVAEFNRRYNIQPPVVPAPPVRP